MSPRRKSSRCEPAGDAQLPKEEEALGQQHASDECVSVWVGEREQTD